MEQRRPIPSAGGAEADAPRDEQVVPGAGAPLFRPALRGGSTSRAAHVAAAVLLFVALALAWEVFAARVGGLLLPGFFETIAAVGRQILDVEVWRAFAISNVALLLGYVSALVTGVPLGFLMGRFPTIEALANPYTKILLVTPLAGFIPILTLTVGIGLTSRVLVVWSFAVVMVIVNCQAGVRQVDSELIDMIRSFGGGELAIWRRVILPGAMPAVLSGLKIALGRAVTGMVIVELLMVSVGIGGLILEYQAVFQAGSLYGVVLLVLAEAILLLWLFERVEAAALPWAKSTDVTVSRHTMAT